MNVYAKRADGSYPIVRNGTVGGHLTDAEKDREIERLRRRLRETETKVTPAARRPFRGWR